MTAWTQDELDRVGDAIELRVATRRPDGSLRPATIIWQVRSGDAIYVRSARGPGNGWFRRAVGSGAGHISSGGVERDVTFALADPAVADEVDAAYHAKYDRYGPGPVGAVTGSDVTGTTLVVTPVD